MRELDNGSYRIIVADDEAIAREALATQIPKLIHDAQVVKVSANAFEVLEYLEAHEADLLLADIRMPMMDGLEMVKQLRRTCADMDIIIISGYADFRYAQQAIRYGVRDYLVKPVDTGALVNAVSKARDSWERKRLSAPPQGRLLPPDAAQDEHAAYSPTVRRLLNIIDEELGNEQLSLKWISSEQMFLNENYLSKLFQREVGQRFSAYLLSKRMQHAMRLMLRDPDIQIHAVAQETGYGDNAQYFSIAFRKYAGLTPTEYKKQIRKGI